MGIKITKVLNDSKNNFDIPREDLNLLNTIGFEIKDLVGFGDNGTVYRGMYGYVASGLRDRDGELLDVTFGQQFAVKYINVKEVEEKEIWNQMNGLNIRRVIEREKQKRKMLFNSNLVQTKICINLGDCQPICLNRKRFAPLALEDIVVSLSYDRLYFVMDFADFGNLSNYLLELSAKGLTVSEADAKNWCKQLVSALQYLHESDVIHGNIKPNNVLLFNDCNQTDGKKAIVAKLSDIGLNTDYYIKPNPNYESVNSSDESSDGEELISDCNKLKKSSKKSLDQMSDIYLLANIFELILKNTSFDSETNQSLAQDLVESMQQFLYKQCNHFLEHKWFE